MEANYWTNSDPAWHYNEVTMNSIASQITSLTILYSTIYSDADQRKHQSCASLAFVQGIHWGLVNSQHKWPVTWKMFPFDDVIMTCSDITGTTLWSKYRNFRWGNCIFKSIMSTEYLSLTHWAPCLLWLNNTSMVLVNNVSGDGVLP